MVIPITGKSAGTVRNHALNGIAAVVTVDSEMHADACACISLTFVSRRHQP